MRTIEKFEKQLNKKLEALTYNDLLVVMQDEKYKEFFATPKNTLEIISELIDRNLDKNFVKELYTTKYSLELVWDETLIDNIFTKYKKKEIIKEKLEEELKFYRKSSNSLLSISAFLCTMIGAPEIDLKSDEERLIDAIKYCKDIFEYEISDCSSSYKLRCDIVDLIYTTREYWWNKYETDILKDIDWVDNETDALTEFEHKLTGNKINGINIKPEQMGFIDITKLKKE